MVFERLAAAGLNQGKAAGVCKAGFVKKRRKKIPVNRYRSSWQIVSF
jgi:hypothetical protein